MASHATTRTDAVPPGKLWFGLTATAAAWVLLGMGDVLIAWWACVQDQQLGYGSIRSGAGILYFIATFLLFSLAAIAGITSYRNWRKLSAAGRLLEAEGRGRREFMALLGVFVSVTLGIGLVWLTVPLLILQMCVRAR